MINDIKIGITGPISESNFGDFAMFVNNVYDLNFKNIILFVYNEKVLAPICNDYLRAYNLEIQLINFFENNKIDIYLNERATQKVGFQKFRFPTYTPLDILYSVSNLKEVEDKIDKIDALIVSGGGYFNHLWNNSLWRSNMLKKIMVPIILASRKNKKIFFTGNTIGPFDDSEEFFFFFFNYIKNAKFAVRDRIYSEKYLKRIGIDQRNIIFVPDDLFFINTLLLDESNDNLNMYSGEKYVVVELYYPLEKIQTCKDQIKDFCENIFLQYGLKVLFLPFDFERGGMWQGEYLKHEIDNFYLYDINRKGYLPIKEAVNIIEHAEILIANRYHAIVMAISMEVPFISLIKKVCDDNRYYFDKIYGLLEYTFDNLEFNEMDFMNFDLPDTLDYVQKNLYSIIEKQKQLYDSQQYKKNKDKLHSLRKNYLDSIRRTIINVKP